MNVLSLFDGMSCGQIALKKLGIDYDKYFACEIDKYAMQVTQHNFPSTIQLGDVQFVTKETFGTHKIDLIMGGSPCQGFSFAGKQLNFDDPRSALFFEFVRLIKELSPKYFLLENVVMKQEYQDVISKYMGCEPIKINSALVSAQTRKRLYWTNIPGIGQPEDKRIILKDIIEREIPGEYEPPYVKLNGKDSGCIGYVGNEPKQATKIYSDNGKSRTLIANAGGQGGKTGLYQIENKDDVKCDMVINQGKELHKEDIDKSHCLLARDYKGFPNQPFTGVRIEQVDDKLRHPEATKKGYAEAGEGEGLDLTFPKSKTRRGRAMKDKSNCLTAASQEMGVVIDPSKPNQINPDKSAKSKSEDEKGTQPHMQDRVFHEDGKSHALTSSFASRTKVGKFEEEDKELRPATIVGRRLNERGVREDYNKDVPITQCLQVKHNSDKSGTLTTVDKDNVLSKNEPGRYPDAYNDKKLSWRKLTPLECERLQTVPDGYTLVMEGDKQKVSNSQRYKMLGNGWTIDVITHILKNMEL